MAGSLSRKGSSDSLTSPLFSPQSPNRNNEYPFPRYDSAQRPGSSGRYQSSRRGSIASSIHSIGGSLDTTTSNWTHSVQEAGQNAISTLLQPPIVRTGLQPHLALPNSSAHKPPTARDIPPVALTNITHVEPSSFRPYLTQVGALYDALQRARDAEEEHAPWLQRKSSKWDDFSDLVETDGKKSSRRTMSRQASLASLASLSPTESPKPKRRTSGQGGRRAPQAPTPLSTIPAVYFDENFHLENPRTFDVVVERSEVVRSTDDSKEEKSGSNGHATAPRKALATNAILQEKLSWYMDTIEVHLISSISTASSSFFAALGSLRELHHEASESVNRIRGLRNELDALDGQMALGGLDIVNKRRRRENLKQLGDAIQQLKCVVEGVARCEALTDAGDIEMALDAIDALEELIQGEQSDNGLGLLGINKLAQARDLRGTTALQGVNNDMDILRSRIGKAYEGRFLDILLGDLRQHIAAVSTEDTLQRWSSTSQRNRSHNREPSKFPSYLSMSDSFRTELISQLRGLHRSEFTTPATTSYRNIVLKEIKTIIKRPLPSSNDEDTDSLVSVSTIGGRNLSSQDRSAILARNLRALEPAAAEEMLIAIYKGVGESLRRLGTQVKVLLDITSILGDSSATPNSPLSPTRTPNIAALAARIDSGDDSKSSVRQIQEDMHQALDMSNLLGQAVDIAQNQIVKVLRVRSEQSIQQSPTRFLRYFTLNLLFANECEAVSGRGGQALKTVVNGHIKDYVKHLSDSAQQKLASGMESDLWNAKDFNDADTLLLSQILESSDRDPEEWSAGSRPWLPYDEYTTSVSAANGTVDATAKDKARPAKIDSDSYVLPNSAILCLHGLQPFLELMTVIPSMSGDVSPTIVSYLQLFNSRCTQLILGAGATRSVGLKNITTKHLALASQALSFIAAIIPHVREFVRRRAGAGPSASAMMGEYDKVRRLYQEHQNSISDKLVDIMAGRASTHVKAMKHLKWADNGTGTVNAYMDTLVKETSTLHKVLSRHLPDMTIVMIMEPVFKSYKEQLGQAFEDVTLETDAGKQRMLQDVEFFNTKLSKINGSSEVGPFLVQLIQDKKVLKPAESITHAAPAAGSTETKSEEAPLPPASQPTDNKKEANGVLEKAIDVKVPTAPASEVGKEEADIKS